MFKDFNITPGAFNSICEQITKMPAKKSDHNNGYYIVDGLWGTCFFRIARNRDCFVIVGNSNPRCPHTYTKIPGQLADKTFFVYVNYRDGFKVNIPVGCIVVGMHESQMHKSGGWWSQSMLIYSPSGEPPAVEEAAERLESNQICIVERGKETVLTVEKITQGFPVRFIGVNEDGYYIPNTYRHSSTSRFG